MITKLSLKAVRFGAIFALLAMFLSVGGGCDKKDYGDLNAPEGPPQLPQQAQAVISEPWNDWDYMAGATVAFSGSVKNAPRPQDLLESYFTWTSSIQGDLGSGREFARDDLVEGDHTITLTVRDEFGHKIEDSIVIHVLPSECYEFTLSLAESEIVVAPGGEGYGAVFLKRLGGFIEAVDLSLPGAGQFLTAHSFDPPMLTTQTSDISTLWFRVTSDQAIAVPGQVYTFDLLGTSENSHCSTSLSVRIFQG